MFNWLKDNLGIYDIHANLRTNRELLLSISERLSNIQEHLAIQNRELARIIAFVDPLYGKSEFSDERRAESDRIGQKVLQKMIGEYLASNPLPKTTD